MISFFKIYFGKSAPLLIESILFFSFLMTWVMYPETPYQYSLLVSIVALIFIIGKIYSTINKRKLLRDGAMAQATLLSIKDTWVKVNRRRVKKYHFRFEVEGDTHDLYYKSNRRKSFKIGDKMWIHYLPEDKKKAIIPAFYNIKMKEQTM